MSYFGKSARNLKIVKVTRRHHGAYKKSVSIRIEATVEIGIPKKGFWNKLFGRKEYTTHDVYLLPSLGYYWRFTSTDEYTPDKLVEDLAKIHPKNKLFKSQ